MKGRDNMNQIIIGLISILICFYLYVLEDEREMREEIERHYAEWEEQIRRTEAPEDRETAEVVRVTWEMAEDGTFKRVA